MPNNDTCLPYIKRQIPLSSNIAAGLLMVAMGATSLTAFAAIVTTPAGGDRAYLEASLDRELAARRGAGDILRAQRIKWATDHGAVDPEGLIDAVTEAAGEARIGEMLMADFLIGVALQESKGNKNARGSHGEEGAFQVIPADWGPVPKDLLGQARQAMKIFEGLMVDSKGQKFMALAHYNGGDFPGQKSFNYARNVLAKAFQTIHKKI